ncbi:MAG: DUF6033 family protein [Oscillospiraceae bacterium]|nr:DUF6033 family protein [Oscillospiraceae bacterium]
MANNVSNANIAGGTNRSRFDSNQLRPNGEMPTRNGIQGKSLGRVVRTAPTPQDSVELSKKTVNKNTIDASAFGANSTSEQAPQIQSVIDAITSNLNEAANAHQADPAMVYTVSTNTETNSQSPAQTTAQDSLSVAPRATPETTSSPVTSQVTATSQTSTARTAQDVLDELREMMPGWVINGDWQTGFRNIQIDEALLERMAADPAEMERVMSIIRDFEELVPQLEQWSELNPGQSLILSFMLDDDGNLAGLATIRTLLEIDSVTPIEFTGGSTTWLEDMWQKLDVLIEGSRN